MYCKKCGSDIPDNAKFCKVCGEPVRVVDDAQTQSQSSSQQNMNQNDTNQQNMNQQYQNIPPYQPNMDENSLPEKYKPLGAWAYFGYGLLFYIPCIGFIMLLVFALGTNNNVNLRNYARSYFCVYAIWAIIIIAFIVMGGLGAMTSMMSYGYY